MKKKKQQRFKKYCLHVYVDQENENGIMILGKWRRDAVEPNI